MHVVNLGLLYATNASVLSLSMISIFLLIILGFVQKDPTTKFEAIVHSISARMMLCEEKFFNGETFAEQLENAYDDFKDFVRARKIPCSQKMFTPGLVLWPKLMKYSYLHLFVQTV